MLQCAARILSVLIATLALPAWADQYYVRVSVDQVKAGFQRGKNPDRDYLTLYATSTHDPSSRVTSAPTDIGTFVTNQTAAISPNVVTDELLVDDKDTIEIFADIQNRSHTDPSKAISDGMKIAGAAITVLGAGELLQAALASGTWAKGLNKEGGVVALSGAVLALAGEVVGDVGGWLGLSDPDCDGPVFAPRNPVLVDVGKFFAGFPGPVPLDTPLGIMLWSDDTQQSPAECGHAPSATLRVNLVLTRSPLKPDKSQFGTPPGPPTHFKPIATGLRPGALIGTWGDRGFIEGSRVVVSVKPADPSALGDAPHFRHTVASDSGVKGERQAASVRRFDPQVLKFLGQPPDGHVEISPAATPDRWSVDITEQLQSFVGTRDLRIQGASTATVPMQSFPFQGNRFPSRNAVVNNSSPIAGSSASRHFRQVRQLGPSGATAGGSSVHNIAAQFAMAFADSLPLPNGVTVQLYGGYDAQERYAGPRLRYLRTDDRGNVVTDVMLQGAQHVPR